MVFAPLSVLARHPQDVVFSAVIGMTGGNEEEIGDAVHVADDGWIDVFSRLFSKLDD